MINSDRRRFVILLLIIVGGMLLRADGLWDHKLSPNEDHYAAEAPFITSNYYFFVKYHTHPIDEDIYWTNLWKYTTKDYQVSGIYPIFLQGHPTLFPLILNFFPSRMQFLIDDPSTVQFLNKTKKGFSLTSSGGPADIKIIDVTEKGGVIIERNIGSTRKAALVFGTLMVLLTYIITIRLFDQTTALISSAIIAFSPQVVSLVKLSDNELVLTVFMLITIYYYIRAFEKNDSKFFILAGVFHGLALGTKFTAFGLFPIVLIFMISNRSNNVKILQSFIISILVLSLFSHPISAISEVMHPSHLKVESLWEFIAALNATPILLLVLIILYIVVSKYQVGAPDKMLIIYTVFFAFTPYLISYRQYILAPTISMLIGAITAKNIKS